jgi:hypothetical protein
MIYAIGYREYIEGSHQFTIKEHITKEEYDRHQHLLDEVNKINAMKNVYELLENNGKEYLSYASKVNEYIEEDENKVFLEANRLIINYLSSLSMFVDYGERHNKKHFGKARMQKFREKTHEFYDGHVSYRFMAMMRQYAVHYDFPLDHIRQSLIDTSGIFALKETLLKFSGWKHAKKDIEQMPPLIDVNPHIEISMMFIKNLYEDFIYDMAPTVIKGVEHMNSIVRENGGHPPLFATFKNEEEFKKGNINISMTEPREFMKALDVIKSHPSITIKTKS